MDNIHSEWEDVEAVAMAIELSDPGQPYSCSSWEYQFDNSTPLIVHGGSPYYHWWGMFETTYVPAHVFIDHTMTVYYHTNTLGSYAGNARIEEMLIDCGECLVDGVVQDFGREDCCEIFGGTWNGDGDYDEVYCDGGDAVWSSLCFCSGTTDSDGDGIADECDDCFNSAGDPNQDSTIDILDIVSVVNIILNGGMNSPNYTDCELSNANYNGDATINVLDIIQIINNILGSSRVYADNDAHSDLYLEIDNDNLIINIDSDVNLSGVELSFYSDYLHNISLNDNSADVFTSTKVFNGIQRFVGFSMDNTSFNNDLEIIIEGGASLGADDINITLSSLAGTEVTADWNSPELKSFEINKRYPNPFNPSTEINYSVSHDGDMRIAVYNLLGQEVAELYNGYQNLGSHRVVWNAENIPSGVYYVSMVHSDGQTESMKAVLLK